MSNTSRSIVYVWDADYPWDVRTEKICVALTEAGHDVHIVARNRSRRPLEEKLREGTVHRMPPWSWAGRKLDDALGFPAFFNPRWRSLIANTAISVNADLIIARDLPLCPTAISVGRRLHIPVILDMAENYPEMLRDIWTSGRNRLIDYAVRNPRLAELVENYSVTHADHIITVVDASSARLRNMGVGREKLTVVSNTPPLSRASNHTLSPDFRSAERVKVVYLGLLEIHRGLYQLLDAIRLLHDQGHTEFQAIIIGSGRDEQLFRERAAALGLTNVDVEFLGRLPYREALDVVASAQIGVIPHLATESWNTTIPNKLFDYMSFGIPVISSDTIPCTKVLAETGAGRTFRSGDAASLAAAILQYEKPEARSAAGAAGTAAIRSKYNWEADGRILLEVVANSRKGV